MSEKKPQCIGFAWQGFGTRGATGVTCKQPKPQNLNVE